MRALLFAIFAISTSFATQHPMPGFMYPPMGGGGGNSGTVICDSACQSKIGPGEGTLYRPKDSSLVAIPNGGVGQIYTSRGAGLRPTWTNPSAINAFTYGAGDSLVSNPNLANVNAKFIQVTDTTWDFGAGSAYVTPIAAANDTTRYVRFTNDVSSIWVGGTSMGADIVRSMATNGSRIVAVGGTASNFITTSDDGGATWTPRTSASTGTGIQQVIWVQSLSLWVAVGDRSTTGKIQTSPDGTTWTERYSIAQGFYGVAWSGVALVAVTFDGIYSRSTDGISWSNVTTVSAGRAARAVVWVGTQFLATNGMTSNTSPDGITWTSRGAISTTAIRSVIFTGSVIVAAGDSGKIYTSPAGSLTWTQRSAGLSAASLHKIAYSSLQNRIFIVGSGGTILFSANSGNSFFSSTSGTVTDLYSVVVTSTGVTIAGGDVGVQRQSQPAIRTTVYATAANRSAGTSSRGSTTTLNTSQPAAVSIAGQINITISSLTAPIIGDSLDVTIARGFKSTAYASTANRSIKTSPLGSVLNEYQYTPLVVIIPSQITFNIGALMPTNVPFDFDVVTIDDIIYNLFVTQNASLSPGPYYGYNLVYDFGVDNRWEFGAQSASQYATLTIQNSTTGSWYTLKSTTTGNAGQPITWDTVLTVSNNGVLYKRQTFSNVDVVVSAKSQVIAQTGTLSASRAVTLPSAASFGAGRAALCVIDESGSVTAPNSLVLTRAGSDTINGATTKSIITAYGTTCVVSDGTSKWTVTGSL